jgi:ribulose-5-phosphate 4-epimerase/fuculose-1-phosphate aldolase
MDSAATPQANTQEERTIRIELAAAYRLAAQFGWTTLIFNHITARVPGPERHFLINRFGHTYEEVTASNLVKVDLDGNVIGEPAAVNRAGFVLHSAIHAVREDVMCAMHTHTPAGVAVSAMECGLQPVNLEAMLFYGRLAYHDFEGITIEEAEKPRLLANLGDKNAMILRNHGLLVCGRSVAEAFKRMFDLELACQVQIAAMASGKLHLPSPEVAARVADQSARFDPSGGSAAQRAFAALMRRLDAGDPSYRD